MIHYIETLHMSQLQNSKLSVRGEQCRYIFLMFWIIISSMLLVPRMFFFQLDVFIYSRKMDFIVHFLGWKFPISRRRFNSSCIIDDICYYNEIRMLVISFAGNLVFHVYACLHIIIFALQIPSAGWVRRREEELQEAPSGPQPPPPEVETVRWWCRRQEKGTCKQSSSC